MSNMHGSSNFNELASSSTGASTSGSTRQRFVSSLRRIASALDDSDDFASELAERFRKRSSNSDHMSAGKKKKSKRGPKVDVFRCRLTCLADSTATNIRNLGRILAQLNNSGLGIAPNERTSANRQSTILPLSWSEERLDEFLCETFPALKSCDGYDLLYADSSKKLHSIPVEYSKTPEGLKKFQIGRSAIYIKPRQCIPCNSPAVNMMNESCDVMLEHVDSEIFSGEIDESSRINEIENDDGQEKNDDSEVCLICKESLTTYTLGTVVPCQHKFHYVCIYQWHMFPKKLNTTLSEAILDGELTSILDSNESVTDKARCPKCNCEMDDITMICIENVSPSTSIILSDDLSPPPSSCPQPITISPILSLPPLSLSIVTNPPVSASSASLPIIPEPLTSSTPATVSISPYESPPSRVSSPIIVNDYDVDCDVYIPQCFTALRESLRDKRIFSVRRQHLVNDVLTLYEDPTVHESMIEVQFEGESAIDFGGVTRDLFCSFWDQVLNNSVYNLFYGNSSKVPTFNAVNASVVMSKLPIMGSVLSHSYLLTGCFPTSLSLASMISLFLGNDAVIDETILLNSFYDFLPAPESDIIKKALTLSVFDPDIKERLLDIYTANNFTRLPSPSTFKSDILQLARFILCLQPSMCLSAMLSGLSSEHKQAWSTVTVDDFVKIYNEQELSVNKIIKAMTPDIEILNAHQERVMYYLKTFIREIPIDLLKRMLRFITGSDKLLVTKISVTFHGSFQFPKAMTCGNALVLSTQYTDYFKFKKDFTSILQNDESFLMLSA